MTKSNSFKELMDNAFLSNNISINSLSNTIGVERTWLQHALAGRRPLGYDNFEKIMKLLSLTPTLSETIRESFAHLHFGSETLSNIKYTLGILNSMAEFELFTPPFLSDITNIRLSEIFTLCKIKPESDSFFECFLDILIKEYEYDTPIIYTNYDLQNDHLRSLILHILRFMDKPIDYKHITHVSSNDSERFQIASYLYQYEFAGYGYNIYSSMRMAEDNSSPLPYFIITHDHVLLFSNDFTFYIKQDDTGSLSHMNKYFLDLFTNSHPFAFYLRDQNDFAKFTLISASMSSIASTGNNDLSPNICLATGLTEEILSESLPANLPNRELLIQGISHFYSLFRDIPMNVLFNLETLMDYVCNDELICNYHYVTFDCLSLSPKNKLKLLLSVKELIHNGIWNIFLLNSEKINLPSYFHINTLGNAPMLGFDFKIYDPKIQTYSLAVSILNNPIICQLLCNVSEYIIHSSLVYTSNSEYGETQINYAIASYCQKHGFNLDELS